VAKKNNRKTISKYTAEEITVLEGLQPVRKRPGMYIGSTDSRGLHHLATEIIDNSVDEAIAGFATDVYIIIEEDNHLIVFDNGRGIPVDKHKKTGLSALELTMTKLHAGAKFDNRAYQASGGLHGIGASAVNALSSNMKVEVIKDKNLYFQKYKKGTPQTKVTKTKIPKKRDTLFYSFESGTKTSFVPDYTIFKRKPKFKFNKIKKSLRERAYLVAGLYFHLYDKRNDNECHFYFEGGIKSLIKHLNKNKKPLHPVIYGNKQIEDEEMPIGVEIALQYNESFSENIVSFANVINTPDGGTHLTGFRTALTKAVKNYAEKKGFLEKTKGFAGSDLKEGLTAVIFVKMPASDIQFESQTKTKLNNQEAQSAVYTTARETLDVYFEEHPRQAKTILEKAMLAAKARRAARAAKDAVVRKGALSGMALPGKLADCQSRKASKSELFIVEGDSAGGSAKQGRDRRFQAILPLGGKVLNTERARLDKIINFDELKALIIALGMGIGETLNLKKLRYHKIIIMCDADVDGEHIVTLLLTFFYRHLKEVVSNGYLYVALPPLFKISAGKKNKYAYTEKEKTKIIKKFGNKKTSTQRYKGLGEMNPNQLWETTMNPEKRTLKRITVEDASKADQVFNMLMGSKVPPRKRFIQTHAKMARLDV